MGILDKNKIYFALVNAIMFILIASPPVYSIVATILGLDTTNNKTSLLFVHGVVFGLLTLLTINIVNS